MGGRIWASREWFFFSWGTFGNWNCCRRENELVVYSLKRHVLVKRLAVPWGIVAFSANAQFIVVVRNPPPLPNFYLFALTCVEHDDRRR